MTRIERPTGGAGGSAGRRGWGERGWGDGEMGRWGMRRWVDRLVSRSPHLPISPSPFLRLAGNRERELTAVAHLACEFQLSAQEFDQAMRNGKPQAHATAGPTRRGVDLAEALEDPLLFLGWNADAGIGDGKTELCTTVVQWLAVDRQSYRTAIGKLYRVPQQISSAWLSRRPVAADRLGQIDCLIDSNGQALALGRRSDQGEHLIEQRSQRHGLQPQFQLSGIDAGQIEQIVDEHQERRCRIVQHGDSLPLAVVKLRLLQLFGDSQNGVERSPQFMARNGQKTGFCLVGLLGCVLGRGQFQAGRLKCGKDRTNPSHGGTEDEPALPAAARQL